MNGQVNIFEYLDSIDYLPFLANRLKQHCKEWKYDWLDRLQTKKTAETFIKHFCNVTTTYFFYRNDEFLGATFDKKSQTVGIYVCGKNYTGEYVEVYEVNELIKLL